MNFPDVFIGNIHDSIPKGNIVVTFDPFRSEIPVEEITEFERPTRIRWAERSMNQVTATEGGYDLAPDGSGTRVTVHNILEGHGIGKLFAPLALRSARKGADQFAQSIKAAVEAF